MEREAGRASRGKSCAAIGCVEGVNRSTNVCQYAAVRIRRVGIVPTFFILALRKLRTKNLNRSSSVCMMMSLKFVLGSMLPVWSSTSSIWLRH
jgi:hypothetical protein